LEFQSRLEMIKKKKIQRIRIENWF